MTDMLSDLIEKLSGYRGTRLPHLNQRPSAVLVPVLDADDPALIYTLRADHLKHHASQFSFPGGRIESGETGIQTALRESEEEIGLDPDSTCILGRIDDVYSPRGYHIQCHVGLVRPFEPRLNSDEVAEIIRVPLSDLADSRRHRVETWERDARHLVHFYQFDQGLVWGVTGKITHNLSRLLGVDSQAD